MEINEIATKSDIENLSNMILSLRDKLEKKMPSLLSAEQVQKQLCISNSTLWRWEKEGKLKSKRPKGTRKRFYIMADILKALESEENEE